MLQKENRARQDWRDITTAVLKAQGLAALVAAVVAFLGAGVFSWGYSAWLDLPSLPAEIREIETWNVELSSCGVGVGTFMFAWIVLGALFSPVRKRTLAMGYSLLFMGILERALSIFAGWQREGVKIESLFLFLLPFAGTIFGAVVVALVLVDWQEKAGWGVRFSFFSPPPPPPGGRSPTRRVPGATSSCIPPCCLERLGL